jgi:hypothetical protein
VTTTLSSNDFTANKRTHLDELDEIFKQNVLGKQSLTKCPLHQLPNIENTSVGERERRKMEKERKEREKNESNKI